MFCWSSAWAQSSIDCMVFIHLPFFYTCIAFFTAIKLNKPFFSSYIRICIHFRTINWVYVSNLHLRIICNSYMLHRHWDDTAIWRSYGNSSVNSDFGFDVRYVRRRFAAEFQKSLRMNMVMRVHENAKESETIKNV